MTMQERRCGFCSQPVDGKTTDVALPSEAVAAHPASFVVPLTSRQHEMIKRLRAVKDRPNISSLARDYGVSRKTIIRDLQDLIQRGQLPEEIYPDWARNDGHEE